MNIFFNPYTTPFGNIPFDKINNSHYLPAIKKGIEQAKNEIEEIVKNTDQPTFDNVLVALENSGEMLNRVTTVFFNLNSAETSDEMQAIAQEISPLLSAHSADVSMNEALFSKVKTVYAKGFDGLHAEQKTLLENAYKGFARNGANLNEAGKEKLRNIDSKKAKLSLTFGENVLKESNSFEMLLKEKKDLDGLPAGVKDAAKHLAKAKNKEGWLFTLDYPSYIPFVTYSTRRDLREKIYKAFSAKAFHNNEYNNESVIHSLVKLRAERAELLGYDTHAHYVLAERMAKTPENVLSFLNDLQNKALPFAQKEFTELAAHARTLDNINQLQKWDAAYYQEKMKKARYSINDELLRPYFQLEKVVQGVFQTATLLFGITFHKRDNIAVYHTDVTVYEVKDKYNKHLGLFYTDFFPRPGKRQGAWMTSFRSQKLCNGKDQRPHVSIVCNFTKPTDTLPSLLTFNEVTTLFHEFGHALHGMLAAGTYASLSGTSVYWDFVELPSQLLENWCYEKQCLDLFAKHYKTGETIPKEYVQKIRDSSNFMTGMATIRQIALAKIDVGWHYETHENMLLDKQNIQEKESKSAFGLDFYPPVSESCISTSFSHIFQGGYSSGYYSYKWAEVLDADAFEAFVENGIFDTKTANSFKENILSAGGTEHPSILYERFRGREAKVDALLKRAGLI